MFRGCFLNRFALGAVWEGVREDLVLTLGELRLRMGGEIKPKTTV